MEIPLNTISALPDQGYGSKEPKLRWQLTGNLRRVIALNGGGIFLFFAIRKYHLKKWGDEQRIKEYFS
jgi:hypothetical protein